MMELVFTILAGIVAGGAFAAVTQRKLVHSVLCLTAAFAGIAGLFLLLGAEFVGFAQLLIYVGAVAILMVFALLLTRNAEKHPELPLVSPSWISGAAIAVLVFGMICFSIIGSDFSKDLPAAPSMTVAQIGDKLMADYVIALEVLGLLLTVSMIGAVILALEDKEEKQ